MIDAHRGAAPRRYSRATWLLASGVVLAVIGLLGGLAAKRSADTASFRASQHTRLISNDPSNPLALSFDPSSGHYVPPDYTVFWVGMLVVALGLIAMASGIGIALAKRRAA